MGPVHRQAHTCLKSRTLAGVEDDAEGVTSSQLGRHGCNTVAEDPSGNAFGLIFCEGVAVSIR